MLDYYRREIESLIKDLDQVAKHFAAGETLAALGAWMAVEKRLPMIGAALALIASVYPRAIPESQTTKPIHKEEKQYGNKKANRRGGRRSGPSRG